VKDTLKPVLLSVFTLVLFAVPFSVSAQEPDESYKYGVPPLDIETYQIFDGRVI
jgi:hypothetical protein